MKPLRLGVTEGRLVGKESRRVQTDEESKVNLYEVVRREDDPKAASASGPDRPDTCFSWSAAKRPMRRTPGKPGLVCRCGEPLEHIDYWIAKTADDK